jgi:hypothetical protein
VAVLVARGDLALLGEVNLERRRVLIAVGMGEAIPDIARAMGALESTTWSRLRLGRLEFLAALRRAKARGR